MRRPRGLTMALAAAATLAAAAPAAAATPFTAGHGDSPAVAVEPDGTGHVVWITTDENARVAYCRIPSGGEACDRTALLNFADATAARPAGRPSVFVPVDGRVLIVGHCTQCGASITPRTYLWASRDGGTTFDPTVRIGTDVGSDGKGTWLADADVFVGADRGRVKASRTGSESGTGATYASGSIFDRAQVVGVPGTSRLVAAVLSSGQLKYGVYRGSGTSPTAINDAANWLTEATLHDAEPGLAEPSLSTGPDGAVLAYRHGTVTAPVLGLRRYDLPTAEFGAARHLALDGIDHDPRHLISFQDAAGRIHLAWRSPYDGGRLRYTSSDGVDGAFSPPANLAIRESFTEPEIAATAAGRGFAVWTNGAWGDVRIVALDPQPEPAPPAETPLPPPPSSPESGPAPATLAPAAPYSGPIRIITRGVPGGTVSVHAPAACVRRGQPYRVTLRWRRVKRKGSVFVKVRRVDFSVNGRRVAKVRRPPFARRFVVRPGARPGSMIRLRARAFIKVRRGKSPTKSIRVTIRVCR